MCTPRQLGKAVRRRRHELGFTQEELSAASGLHATYLGGIERGERNPTLATISRISNALNWAAWELVAAAAKEQDP